MPASAATTGLRCGWGGKRFTNWGLLLEVHKVAHLNQSAQARQFQSMVQDWSCQQVLQHPFPDCDWQLCRGEAPSASRRQIAAGGPVSRLAVKGEWREFPK